MTIDCKLDSPHGNIQALSHIVALRQKELGETAKQSCIAMAINVLRSLRAQTKIANENKANISLRQSDDKYYPSFIKQKGVKGKRVAKRVLRQGQNGAVITPEKVIWRLPRYYKGQVAHSYEVEDRIADGKTIKYILVCESEKDAKKIAKQLHVSRVKRFKSLARIAISLCMKAVWNKGQIDNASAQIMDVASRNTNVSINENGFNSGNVNVHVEDNLNYATDALRDGMNSVNTAINNAVKKAIGNIKQKIKRTGGNIDQSLLMKINELIGD